MIRAYISHSIRGKYGKDATPEQMKANNDKAVEFGRTIKKRFSGIDFYVPGDHDEFVMVAFFCGYITEEQILDVDCRILSKCNFLINYMPDHYISNGMEIENIHAGKCNIPIFNVYSDNMNAAPIRVIEHYLSNLVRG